MERKELGGHGPNLEEVIMREIRGDKPGLGLPATNDSVKVTEVPTEDAAESAPPVPEPTE